MRRTIDDRGIVNVNGDIESALIILKRQVKWIKALSKKKEKRNKRR